MDATLPDYLRDGLAIVSIGINPSPNSVRHGYPFATTRNRFWPALNASDLVSRQYHPSIDSMHDLMRERKIGFTDVVKRVTSGARDLKTKDFRQGAPLLREKLQQCRPNIVWFQGKMAYRYYRKFAEPNSPPADIDSIDWGRQADSVTESSVCFVTPNPSPANAQYSLQDLIEFFNELAALRVALDTESAR